MKRKIQILASAIFSIIISTSCIFMEPSVKGNGNVVEEKRNVGEFNEIKVSRGMNVYISQGEQIKVLVRADENLLELIETNIVGDALEIKANKNIKRAESKKVFVTVPNLSVIKSSSGSNVYSETEIRSKKLELSTSSGSNMKLEVDARSIDASTSSGSNMKLEGSTTNFSGKASSGSNIKAKELKTDDGEMKVSSGANIWITVKDKMEAHASSGGNVFYSGSPGSTNIEKSSGGNVIKK